MNRYLATGLVATSTGMVLVFVAHGCALNPFAGYSYDEAQTVLAGGSSSGSGGAGGVGGAGGTGGAMTCMCEDDDNECTDDLVDQECPDGGAEACHTAVANRGCTQGNGNPGFCGSTGACRSCQECADSECTKRCNGQLCQTNTVCESEFCVDGYCCDFLCTGPCNVCNRVLGTCSQLPYGMVGECPMGQLCGNTGTCKTATKAPLGALCTTGSDCETGVCWAQICLSPNDQPCAHSIECASNLCDSMKHVCVSCEDNIPCPEGAACLPGGRCQVFPGQPATNDDECTPPAKVNDMLMCTLAIDAECTDHFECIYRRCNGAPNGKCANACAKDGDCPSGTTCNSNGQCTLPPGSYCVTNNQCESGTCAGFPRKCQ